MQRFRVFLAAFLCPSLIAAPVWSSPVTALGTVVTAERAHVSDAAASVGATVYGGDRLVTEASGSLQIRTGASRLYLAEASAASIAEANGTPQVTLIFGTTVFSTSSNKGLELLFKDAHIRPLADGPTVAQIKVAGPKELLVTTRRGALVFSMEEESEVIPEGNTIRVILDPPAPAAAQGPRGVGAPGQGKPARIAGRNHFIFVLAGLAAGVGVATAIAVDEAFESPSKP